MSKIKKAEYRTTENNEKGLTEQRADLLNELRAIVDKAEAEKRSLSEEEDENFKIIKDKVISIDNTLQAIKEAREMAQKEAVEVKETKEKEEKRTEPDNNEVLRYMFGGKISESRASAVAMNTTTNAQGGYVVNKELSKDIIKAIKDRSDVYNFFNSTSIKGNLRIPKQTSTGTASWVGENPSTSPTATIPTIDIIELGQNRLYRESALTQQMINTQELDLEAFVKGDIADTMTDAIENAIFNGTGTNQPTGIINGIKTANKISVGARGKITVEDLKKAKAKLKQSVVIKAKWFMNSDTFLALDLLTDSMGRSLIQPDPTNATGYRLLGLDVVLTDAMPTLSDTGAKCLIVLATPEAYHTNTQKNMALYVYKDASFIRNGLVGYGADIYMDGKTRDDQQLAGVFNIA